MTCILPCPQESYLSCLLFLALLNILQNQNKMLLELVNKFHGEFAFIKQKYYDANTPIAYAQRRKFNSPFAVYFTNQKSERLTCFFKDCFIYINETVILFHIFKEPSKFCDFFGHY